MTYRELRAHLGHHVVIVCYGKDREPPVNVSLECESCGEVIEDHCRSTDEMSWDDVPAEDQDRLLKEAGWDGRCDPETQGIDLGGLFDKWASTSPDDRWADDSIQFPRLLCEIVATCDSPSNIIEAVAESMDLSIGEVNKLFDRAHAAWEKIKAEVTR